MSDARYMAGAEIALSWVVQETVCRKGKAMKRPGCFGAFLTLLFAPVVIVAKVLVCLVKKA